MAPTCQLQDSVVGVFRKGTTVLSSSLNLGEYCTPTLRCMSDTSVTPHMLLVSFKLLPQCWSSEGVSLHKSICRFFKRNCWGLQKFLLLTQSPLVNAARSYGDLSSWYSNPGLGGQCQAGIPHFRDMPHKLLSTTHWCGIILFHISVSLFLLLVWMDMISLITQLLCQTSHFFQVFFWRVLLFFCLWPVSLSPYFGCHFVFVSIYQVDLL